MWKQFFFTADDAWQRKKLKNVILEVGKGDSRFDLTRFQKAVEQSDSGCNKEQK